jgi:hypothetical protein
MADADVQVIAPGSEVGHVGIGFSDRGQWARKHRVLSGPVDAAARRHVHHVRSVRELMEKRPAGIPLHRLDVNDVVLVPPFPAQAGIEATERIDVDVDHLR